MKNLLLLCQSLIKLKFYLRNLKDDAIRQEVSQAIRRKMRSPKMDIPTNIVALNMRRYRQWKARQVRLEADITTKYFTNTGRNTNTGKKRDAEFVPRLAHPDIVDAIHEQLGNIHVMRLPSLTPEQKILCNDIQHYDEDKNPDIYELVYQIMLRFNWCSLDDTAENIRSEPHLICRAIQIAEREYPETWKAFWSHLRSA